MTRPAPAAGLIASRGPLARAHDVALLDLDGVVYVGDHEVPGATAALARAREQGLRPVFVTNNAARTPDTVAEQLVRIGVPAGADDVVTSAQAAASLLLERLPAGSNVLVVGGVGLRTALREQGLMPVTSADEHPAAVAQGFAPEVDWRALMEACVAIRAGATWVATNADLTLPTARGPGPGNGALVEVVRRTTGAEPVVAGKPCRPIMDEAVARTGARCALVVGDRLDTDLEGARASDLPGLLVLTGVSGVYDLLAAPPRRRPAYLGADLSALLDAHEAPVPADGGWRCGSARAWVEGGTLRVRVNGAAQASVPTALDVVRAACSAVWEVGDADGSLDLTAARQVLAAWTAAQGWDR